MYDYIIVGIGIVGLGVANALQEQHPDVKILMLDKESEPAMHQSGHNSNVVHSGIYYKPGSLKARLAKQGNQTMYAFCREHNLYYDRCGKVIVATSKEELPRLHDLYERGLQNGLAISKLNITQLLEREPYVNGIEAILVPDAGIVNYKQVADKLAEIVTQRGATLVFNQAVINIKERSEHVEVITTQSHYQAKTLINCGGLYSDRLAKMAGYDTGMKIIPFRGEYYILNSEKNYLVNHLIYPVPNPEFPFLGVHFTRMYDGKRDLGPNAVLAFKREGYKKTDFDFNDLRDVLSYSGFWKIAGTYFKEGMAEMFRSISKKHFVENARQLMPALRPQDIKSGPAGVRAQALTTDGKLVDDFHIVKGRRSLHICNAPSPAATASIEIGREIVKQYFAD